MENKHLIVDGVIAAQLPKASDAFKTIIQDFSLIIEIGYHRGAFSRWLNQNKQKSAKLVCYDISDGAREVTDLDIDFRVGDCFNEDIITEISELIKKSKKTLLLCDGGNKNSEFNLYAKYLKKGDVIMLHDYHDDTCEERYEDFSGSEWGSEAESYYSSIKSTVDEISLKKYNYDLFRSVLWGAFNK
jgi:23S rRNA U2552 (ribose-2'-O)-methylase RlmE/FtsJ